MTLFLGTGCGRSGTTWTAEFFTRIGYETRHEFQFSAEYLRPFTAPEVSWLAIPFLPKVPESTRLLRIVRNPYDVVISGMQCLFQTSRRQTVFDQFLDHHAPFITKPDDKLGRIIRWVALWDEPMDDRAHTVLRPDADRLDRIGEVVEYATGEVVSHRIVAQACQDLGSRVNHKVRSVSISKSDIDAHPEGWRIQQRAERFGYA